jgi:putative DNA primase/helicase
VRKPSGSFATRFRRTRPRRLRSTPKRNKPSRIETYRNACGDLIGSIYRFDLVGGSKEFLRLAYCRSAGGAGLAWRWQSWPPPRPLYGLDRIAKRPKAPVIVCEGEKAAEAAASLLPDHVWVTSPNESQSVGKADWSPVHRRDVTIWPDADDPGDKYADTLARLLAPIALPGLPNAVVRAER